MTSEVTDFIQKYVSAINNDNAAVFVGSGFSLASGYVDWKTLLEPIARELRLDINKETDLVTLAQYYVNKDRSKNGICTELLTQFTHNNTLDENHKILARLPVSTYWTTNYDSLIEESLEDAQKAVDVKRRASELSITLPQRDAIVYKMHGDASDTGNAIIVKDDYEQYYRSNLPFVTALSNDLTSKTFLFIGFSFTDPNINYILSRIRIEYASSSPKTHYAIFRKPKRSEYDNQKDYDYQKRKFDYFILDLEDRYHIKAVLIDEYSEITEILKGIRKQINRKNIFISGSAKEYGDYSEEEALALISDLSEMLIQKGYNIISGFGLGVGSAVISGALQEIYIHQKKRNENRLLLFPFPQGIQNKETKDLLWRKYREDMISRAGISIFLFGNKETSDKKIIPADGVEKEYNIACLNDNIIVPVGCTGYKAKEIWDKISSHFSDFYSNTDPEFKEAFNALNSKVSNDELIANILHFLSFYT